MIVVDEKGNQFASLGTALRAYGLVFGGSAYTRFERDGKFEKGGHVFTAVEGDYPENVAELTERAKTKEDPLLARLRARYTDDELKFIAEGKGISNRFIPFPEVRLRGEHHRILVMSDTHIGSVYSPIEWHLAASEFANDPSNGVECIVHCGDLVDGLKIGRAGTQIYELSEIGFEAQRDKAISLMSMYDLPIYIISGNHDAYFVEYAGADIVQAVCGQVEQMTYVGKNSADIDVGGCVVRLFHGGDGSSYALSYRLQKLVEALPPGKKPDILLAGHVHKFCYIYDRGIHAISAPSMQAQTKFMEARKLAAHTGFLVLDFETLDGRVSNLSVTYYPFNI